MLVSIVLYSQECTTTDVQSTTVIFSLNDSIKESEHEFSFDKTKKIHFAIGNLQYRPSTGEWRLAPQQFDYVGGHYSGDADVPDDDYGTIYINGNKCWNRYSGEITSSITDWMDAFNFNDLSKLNNRADTTFLIDGKVYRIPTSAELSYLVNDRPKADTLRARVQIILNTPTPIFGNTFVNGILLLPDDWDPKIWIQTPIIPDLDGINGCWNYFDNRITENEWYILEAQGAVFLPAAGNATGRGNSKYNRSGFYWTITPNSAKAGTYFSLEFGGYEYRDDKTGYRINTFPEIKVQEKTVRRTIRLCRDIEE